MCGTSPYGLAIESLESSAKSNEQVRLGLFPEEACRLDAV